MTPSSPHSLDNERVTVSDVSRHFGRRRAVSRVSFVATRGAIVGLLGPNGAGKSTLLAMLATLLQPSAGTIRDGAIESSASPALRARIGVLGHDLFLYPEVTARENLRFFAALYGLPQPDSVARAALDRAGLADRGDDVISSFSRGMRQRVALERALLHQPRLVLLDEPFTGLDEASAAALIARLRHLRQDGGVIVLATHDLDLSEGLLNEAVFLRDGRMVQAVSQPDGLRSTYRSVMTGSHPS